MPLFFPSSFVSNKPFNIYELLYFLFCFLFVFCFESRDTNMVWLLNKSILILNIVWVDGNYIFLTIKGYYECKTYDYKLKLDDKP